MMEFLDKIYGYEHFGIILFAVIAFLVVLFMIVLFFGKKDEKKRELERTKQLEAQAVTDAFAQTDNVEAALNVNEPTFAPVENIIAENTSVDTVIPEDPVVEQEPIMPEVPAFEETINKTEAPVAPVLEPIVEPSIFTPIEEVSAPVVEEMPTIEPVITPEVEIPQFSPVVESNITESVEEIKIPDFNFDELAASIAKELSALERKEVEPVAPVAPTIESTPVVPVEPVAATITPINEVVKPAPTPGPVTFSSVYINKPAEPVKEVQVVEPIAPVTPVAPVTPTPVQNMDIELPKPAEMPMLNKEVNEPVVNNEPTAIPDFSQFEGESYNIK